MRKSSLFIGLLLSVVSLQGFALEVGGSQGGGFSSMLIMMVVFVAIFYFMMIRPQMQRSKEHKNLLSNLTKGDEVITSGGMIGKIKKVGDNFIELTVSENVDVKVQKQAVTSALPKGTAKLAN